MSLVLRVSLVVVLLALSADPAWAFGRRHCAGGVATVGGGTVVATGGVNPAGFSSFGVRTFGVPAFSSSTVGFRSVGFSSFSPGGFATFAPGGFSTFNTRGFTLAPATFDALTLTPATSSFVTFSPNVSLVGVDTQGSGNDLLRTAQNLAALRMLSQSFSGGGVDPDASLRLAAVEEDVRKMAANSGFSSASAALMRPKPKIVGADPGTGGTQAYLLATQKYMVAVEAYLTTPNDKTRADRQQAFTDLQAAAKQAGIAQ